MLPREPEENDCKGATQGASLGVVDSSVRCFGGGYTTVGLSKSTLYTKKNDLDPRRMERKSIAMPGNGMQT